MLDGIEKDEVKDNIKESKMFHVIFLNDDYTPMDFVTSLLKEYFGKSDYEANKLMMEVHENKSAMIGTYTKDIAQVKCKIVKELAQTLNVPFKTKLQPAS